MPRTIKRFCPLCSKSALLLKKGIWNRPRTYVYSCSSCGVFFLSPFMSYEEEKGYYSDYNQHVRGRGVIPSQSPAEFHLQSRKTAADRLSRIREYFRPGMKVLEIGSSTGAFLELIPEVERYGVEPSHNNREFSKKYCQGVVADVVQIEAGQKFNIICMFHTLEHIRNPIEFLRTCLPHLEVGGKVIVEVPNSADPLLTLFNLPEFREFYFQPMHHFVHCEKSLRFIFNELGAEEVKVIHYQRYGLDNHLSWLVHRKPGTDLKYAKLFGELGAYKTILEKSKKTDTIIIIGEGF